MCCSVLCKLMTQAPKVSLQFLDSHCVLEHHTTVKLDGNT